MQDTRSMIQICYAMGDETLFITYHRFHITHHCVLGMYHVPTRARNNCIFCYTTTRRG